MAYLFWHGVCYFKYTNKAINCFEKHSINKTPIKPLLMHKNLCAKAKKRLFPNESGFFVFCIEIRA